MKKLISLVSPCYNEEGSIIRFYNRTKEIRDQLAAEYEFEHIFCDNCSTDKTFEILKGIAAEDPCVKIIRNSRNFGILPNAYNGMLRSSGDAVVTFLPIDMQDPPELIVEFIRKWEDGYKIVYGLRHNREEFILLAYLRKVYYRLLSKITYVDYPPDAGDFQLVDRKIIDEIKKTYMADPFLRMNTFYCGFKSYGFKYTWQKRQVGKSKNSWGSLLSQGLEGLTSFSIFPLRIVSMLGLITSAISILAAIVTLLGVVIGLLPAGQQGILTIVISIFTIGGVNLLALGIIGEYIARILNQVKGRPHVIEQQTINIK